jgi:hypothetical protein
VSEFILIANRFMLMRSHRARFRFLSLLVYQAKVNRKERREFISTTEHIVTRDPMSPHYFNR